MMIRISKALLLFAALNLRLSAAPGETQHYRWHDDGFFSSTDIEMRGTVEFTDNDADIKTISNDGYFRLEQSSNGPARTYLVRPGSNGIERLYSVGGVSKALMPMGGRGWHAFYPR
jgi:hypothetical protein